MCGSTGLAEYGFHAGLCRMGSEMQLTPEPRAQQQMRGGRPSGPGGAAPSRCPTLFSQTRCPVVLGQADRLAGAGKEAEK